MVKKFFLGSYLSLLAAASIAVIVLLFFYYPIKTFDIKTKTIEAQLRLKKFFKLSHMAPSSVSVVCVPRDDGSVAVGGLEQDDIPRLPGALRSDYSNNGTSQYTTRIDQKNILNYYASKLASQCWRLTSVQAHEIRWTKDENILKISVIENPYGGKNTVDYRLSKGQILGVEYGIAQEACSSDQQYCPGYGCQSPGTPCPPSGGTTGGTTGGTSSSCPTPPSGCSYGYIYDSNYCPVSCQTPPSSTCSGSYQSPGSTSPNCNYSACPNGCTWGSDGCPSGCYTSPTCSGEYQQSGSTYPSCNYSRCPNGCDWQNGCPVNCYTPITCTGAYVQPGSTSSCNWSVCPNGCNWDGQCPVGCYQSTTPVCPANQIKCYGSPSDTVGWCQTPPCPPSSGTGTCSGGQIWCPPTSSNTTGFCSYPPCPTIGTTNDKSSCEAGGGLWCQPTVAPHCHPGPNPSPCEPDQPPPGSSYVSSCPQGYFPCNNVCIPNTNTCNTQGTLSCPSEQYLCNNVCVSYSTPCNGVTPQQSRTGNQYQYPTPTPTPYVQCGQCQYSKDGQCVKAIPGTPDRNCPSGTVCDPNGGCTGIRGKYVSNDGANWGICGDGFCDKGEDKVNCSQECNNEPPAVTYPTQTPYPGQYPNRDGQYPGGEGQYPGYYPGGPGDQGYPGGPGGEDGQKYQQRVDEDRLRMMKEGMKQLERMIKQMDKAAKQVERKLLSKKCGVEIPKELKEALKKAPDVLKKIKEATSADEIEELVPDIQDIMDSMQQLGQTMGELMGLCDMLRQADKDVKTIQRSVKRIVGYVAKNPSLGDAVNEAKAIADAMTQTLNTTKELAKTDTAAAFEAIQTEFYDRMEEFWNLVAAVDTFRNLTSGLNQASREIKRAEQKIKTHERNKKYDAETIQGLKDILEGIKESYNELKQLSQQKPLDFEAVRDAAQELWNRFTEFENALSDIGESLYGPRVTEGEKIEFEPPPGFDFGPPQTLGGPEGFPSGQGFGGGFGAPGF